MTGPVEHISGRSEPHPPAGTVPCDVRVWGSHSTPGDLVIDCVPHDWVIGVEGGKRLPFLTKVISQHLAANGTETP